MKLVEIRKKAAHNDGRLEQIAENPDQEWKKMSHLTSKLVMRERGPSICSSENLQVSSLAKSIETII